MNPDNTLPRPLLRTASAVALTLGVLGAASACTNDPAPAASVTQAEPERTVLEFQMSQKDSEFELFDVGKRGDSVGDRNISAATLEVNGEVAGRMQGVCTTLDNAYEGHQCELAIMIKGGTLTLATGGVRKPIENVDGRGDIFAVTGGTGDYLGVAGEMTVSEDGQDLTITLLS
jgi:hypothetical protein